MSVLEIIKEHKIAVSPSHNNSLGKWVACCMSVGFTIPEAYYAETMEEAVMKCYQDVVVDRNITEYGLNHEVIKCHPEQNSTPPLSVQKT